MRQEPHSKILFSNVFEMEVFCSSGKNILQFKVTVKADWVKAMHLKELSLGIPIFLNLNRDLNYFLR